MRDAPKGKYEKKEKNVLMTPFVLGGVVMFMLFIMLKVYQSSLDPGLHKFEADNLIVGCGLSGALLAYFHATLRNESSVIIEKRNHIGGNVYDYVDDNGIRVSQYGPHFFHTNKEKVWMLLTRFSEWVLFENRALAQVGDKVVPLPVTIDTVNTLLSKNIANEEEMLKWLELTQVKYPNGPKNAEEAAQARVGKELYELLFKGYTTKQWNRDPTDLAASVTQRIPVRSNHDNRYFDDEHQAEPELGFTGLVERMLHHPKIKYFLDIDFFDFRTYYDIKKYKKIFYTGPVDAYFASLGFDKLEYRSLKFRLETQHVDKPGDYIQPCGQLNRPSIGIPYTRSTEYKWIPWKHNIKGTGSTVAFEYPSDDGEPYYPVPNPRNVELFEKYQKLAQKEEENNVYFIGRLANYKYFNMDDATLNAIQFYENLYHTKIPVIEQDLIVVTVTRPGQGVKPLVTQHFEPRNEPRLMELCIMGHAIREDGKTYWIVVENGEQPDVLVHSMMYKLGFYHFLYTSVGPTKDDDKQTTKALDYIRKNKMNEVAKVVNVKQNAQLDTSFFKQARIGKTGHDDAKPTSEAKQFCYSILRSLGVRDER